MLYEKNDSNLYIKEFRKKFSNFCEKAPLLLSYTISSQKVSVIDESINMVYEFDWDFTIPVKSFIFGIKKILSKNYPVIVQELQKEVHLTPEEQSKLISEGTPVGSVPVSKKESVTRKFMIDKVIINKDIFILKEFGTDKLFRYKLNKSSVMFLKKIRSGEFNEKDAGKYFFKNSTFLGEIIPKKEA